MRMCLHVYEREKQRQTEKQKKTLRDAEIDVQSKTRVSGQGVNGKRERRGKKEKTTEN